MAEARINRSVELSINLSTPTHMSADVLLAVLRGADAQSRYMGQIVAFFNELSLEEIDVFLRANKISAQASLSCFCRYVKDREENTIVEDWLNERVALENAA